MSFKDITYDPNTNSLIFRSRRTGQKPLKVPMTGFVPVGAVIPICSHLTGAYDCTATTAADDNGFVQCNGQTINDTSSPLHTRVIPDINGSGDATPVFLRGSTSPSSAKGGSDSHTISSANLPVHIHGFGTLVNAAESGHTHGVGTYGNTAESAHTHGVGSYGNTAEDSHTHVWPTGGSANKGYWSQNDATFTDVSGDNGNGSQNTDSDGIAGINAWGNGSYAARASSGQSNGHTHNLTMQRGSGGAGNPYVCNSEPESSPNTYTTDGPSVDHTHQYYLPSHRHWIKARNTTAGSSHNHTFSGTSAAGSSHNHTFSGTSAAGSSHNHTISGSTDNGGFANTAVSNVPKYLSVKYIMRIK